MTACLIAAGYRDFADATIGLMVYWTTGHNAPVNGLVTGYGTLRMNGGTVARGRVGADAHAATDREAHVVKLVMKESFLGGCELELKLSPEEAADFASAVYKLAKQAMLENERTKVDEPLAAV